MEDCELFNVCSIESIIISISCFFCVYLVTCNNTDGVKSIRNMVSASWL